MKELIVNDIFRWHTLQLIPNKSLIHAPNSHTCDILASHQGIKLIRYGAGKQALSDRLWGKGINTHTYGHTCHSIHVLTLSLYFKQMYESYTANFSNMLVHRSVILRATSIFLLKKLQIIQAAFKFLEKNIPEEKNEKLKYIVILSPNYFTLTALLL